MATKKDKEKISELEKIEIPMRFLSAESLPDTLDKENMRFRAWGNTAKKDRYGSVNHPKAWVRDIGHYLSNPVVLWMHNTCFSTKPPIASGQDLQIEEDGLSFWPTWAKDDPDPFARLIFYKYACNPPILRAFSVGWMPIESVKEDILGVGAEVTFTRNELYEISAVDIPGERGALARGARITVNRDTREVNRGTPGRLPSYILDAIEQMGFVQATRISTSSSLDTEEHPVTREEIISTLDVFTALACEKIKLTEKSGSEFEALKSSYKRLGSMLGNNFSSILEENSRLRDEVDLLCDGVETIAKECDQLRTLNADLVGYNLETLTS